MQIYHVMSGINIHKIDQNSFKTEFILNLEVNTLENTTLISQPIKNILHQGR